MMFCCSDATLEADVTLGRRRKRAKSASSLFRARINFHLRKGFRACLGARRGCTSTVVNRRVARHLQPHASRTTFHHWSSCVQDRMRVEARPHVRGFGGHRRYLQAICHMAFRIHCSSPGSYGVPDEMRCQMSTPRPSFLNLCEY